MEFNLSKKIRTIRSFKSPILWADDVKEFIKKETMLIDLYSEGKISYEELDRQRKELAGEKLNGNIGREIN